MIYDKHQFTFNIILVALLVLQILVLVLVALPLKQEVQALGERIADVEDNQNFNFIQGPHHDLNYGLTTAGFFVEADDYGQYNGPSMQPIFFDGHVVIEKDYNSTKLQEGQIVRFLREDGTPVIHRVRADYGSTVFVQGDSLKEGEIIEKSSITHLIVGVVFT